MTDPVHLDHAGASRPSSEVVATMTEHLARERDVPTAADATRR